MIYFTKAFFTIMVIILSTNLASAQMSMLSTGGTEAVEITLPDPLTPEAIRGLVSTLSDAQVRELLLDRLDAVAQAATAIDEDRSVVDFVSSAVAAFWQSVTVPIERLPVLWSSQKESFLNFYDNLGWSGIFTLFGSILLAMLAGFVVERLVIQLTRSKLAAALENDQSNTLRETLRFLFFRLFQEVLGLIAFFVVARNVGTYLIPIELEEFAQVFVLYLVVLPRITIAFIRFLNAPNKPEHRLMNVDDATARFMVRHNAGLVILIGFSVAIVIFNDMNGVELGRSRLGFWLNLLVHVYFIYVVTRAWEGLEAMMRGTDPDVTPSEEKVAKFYPYFLIILVVTIWVLLNVIVGFGRLDLLASQPHYKTMLLLGFAPAMDTVVRGMVRHLVPPMTGDGMVARRAYQSTKRSYIRIGRLAVFGLVVVTVANIWGLSVTDTGVGEQFAGKLLEFVMILAAGYLVWELVSLWINRKLAAEQTALGVEINEEEPGGGEGGGVGSSRLSTVLPLILGIAKGMILTIFGLIALGNLGIDITPLLAGAGILGLAIGFGAQRLVADIVSGIFFLIDDAFRTGEYLDIEGTLGSVEKISIRSMQLRHHKGAVHTIPYGEIPKITNYSRDWVIMKLRFTVPFDTDPNKIKKMFKKIGAEMIVMPEYADDFIQPFKSQGVFDFDDVGMIIRGKFMTKPGKQFMIRKEIYNRVKAAFAAEGIDFARREVRVAIPGLENNEKLSDDEKTAVAAAASQAAQEQIGEAGPATDKPGN